MCTFCHSGPETMVGISAAGMMYTKLKLSIAAKRAARAEKTQADGPAPDMAGATS